MYVVDHHFLSGLKNVFPIYPYVKENLLLKLAKENS